jgi:hypothetical protein
MSETWLETRLWKELEGREHATGAVRVALTTSMPKIEEILRSGATAPRDFTLHDDRHSFRVAERMVDLLPDNGLSKLSNYELGLLLLAAYLHDIGMSPKFETMREYEKLIFGAEDHSLSPRAQEQFLHWLAANYGDTEIPITDRKRRAAGIGLGEEILTYFARDMHNDWSEAWIRQHLGYQMATVYPAWIDDLIIVCKSHHFGLAELKREQFDARMVGTPDQPLNLRFLAALLRVSDVLEFDPKRTPSVILEHRAIHPKSRVYWYKDHDISLTIERQPYRMLFTARTGDAITHKAVLDTAQMVDHELQACAALQHENAFGRGMVRDNARWYNWPWYPKLILNVHERDENFVYIDGAFKPDARHVLQLLSGSALYSSPFAAVRELLQNAFDAVREQLAYQRLLEDNPADQDVASVLARLHHVELTLANDGDRYVLICSDTGVGMTRSIIEQHLLVSGSPTRAEVRDLERRARRRGFATGRTGRFGIGVLSYFMLADEVTILTRRSDESGGDPDRTAWRFSTEGVGSFGQLTRATRSSRGTDVHLRLKEDVVKGGVERWFEQLKAYVRDTLARIPCRLELRSSLVGSVVQKLIPGWTDVFSVDSAETRSALLNGFGMRMYDTDPEFLPRRVVEEREQASANWDRLRVQAGRCIQFIGPIDYSLPDNIGQAQLSLPYYQLKDGASLVFVDADGSAIESLPAGDYGVRMGGFTVFAWRGFTVQFRQGNMLSKSEDNVLTEAMHLNRTGAIVRVNFVDDCEIAVHRETMALGDRAKTALSSLMPEVENLFGRYFMEHKASPYAALSRAIAAQVVGDLSLALPETWNVLRRKRPEAGAQAELHRLSFPAAEFGPVSSADDDIMLCPASVIPPNCKFDLFTRFSIKSDYSSAGRSAFRGLDADAMIIVRRGYLSWFAPVWNAPPNSNVVAGFFSNFVELPPEMSSVAAISSAGRVFLNVRHALVAAARDADPVWLDEKLLIAALTIERMSDLIAVEPRAAAWLLRNLFRGERYWNGLRDTHREFFQRIIEIGCSKAPGAIVMVTGGSGYPGSWEGHKLDATGYEAATGQGFYQCGFKDGSMLKIPTTGPWVVQLQPTESSRD